MNRKTFWWFVVGSAIALSIWFGFVWWDSRKIKLIFCDVGQGTGVILTRGDFQLVYDTGPKNGKFLSCLSENIPFWDKKIEVVIISHFDNDHGGGLAEVTRYYKIDSLYSSQENEQYNYAKVLALDDVLKTNWMEFRVVWTDRNEEPNYGSVVGLLEIGNFKSLFMGDVPVEVEQRLVWSRVKRDLGLFKKLSDVDVLLVGHHGSKNSTDEELLGLTKPKEAVISVGKNSFGHPSKEVLDRLTTSNVVIKRTDRQGSIKYVF